MGGEVVHHHPDDRDVGIVDIDQLAHALGEVLVSAPVGDLHPAPAAQVFRFSATRVATTTRRSTPTSARSTATAMRDIRDTTAARNGVGPFYALRFPILRRRLDKRLI